MTQDHWVYVCRDTDTRPLYVGVTSCGLKRFAHGHSKTAPWWHEVATITVEHLPTRRDAFERERYLIIHLEPPHNIIHSGTLAYSIPTDPGPTRWLSIGDLAGWLDTETDWVLARLRDGMPHALIAGDIRFKADEVRRWLQS